MDKKTERLIVKTREKVRHPVWKYDRVNVCDGKHESHERRGSINDELAKSQSADMNDTNNERWNDPRWQERGSAPSREPGDYHHRYSGGGLFYGGGSRRLPVGLIKRAGEGDGGDDGDAGDGHLPEIPPGGREAPSVKVLPSLSEPGLTSEEKKEEVNRAFAKVLFPCAQQPNNVACWS